MILNRNINIHDDREMAEDVAMSQITTKGLDFEETFWQVHRGYVRSRNGEAAQVTDREIFNIIDNTLRHESVYQMLERISRIHSNRA